MIDDPNRDELLAELAEMDRTRANHDFDDRDLTAYREGLLSEPRLAELEEALIADDGLRRRLVSTVTLAKDAPKSVRTRLFPDSNPVAAARRWGGRWKIAAAAAVVLVSLVCGWQIQQLRQAARRSTVVAALPSYQISIAALVGIRGSSAAAVARPETRVELSLAPVTATDAKVSIALYQLTSSGFERLEDSRIDLLFHDQGAASLRVLARDLVGEVPGRWPFLIAITTGERLPQRIAMAAALELMDEAIQQRLEESRPELQAAQAQLESAIEGQVSMHWLELQGDVSQQHTTTPNDEKGHTP